MVFIGYILQLVAVAREIETSRCSLTSCCHNADHGWPLTHSLQILVTQETRKQDIAEKCKHNPDQGYPFTLGYPFNGTGISTADKRLKDTDQDHGYSLTLGCHFKGAGAADTQPKDTAEECQHSGSRLPSQPVMSPLQGMIPWRSPKIQLRRVSTFRIPATHSPWAVPPAGTGNAGDEAPGYSWKVPVYSGSRLLSHLGVYSGSRLPTHLGLSSLQRLVTQETRPQDTAGRCRYNPDPGYPLTLGCPPCRDW